MQVELKVVHLVSSMSALRVPFGIHKDGTPQSKVVFCVFPRHPSAAQPHQVDADSCDGNRSVERSLRDPLFSIGDWKSAKYPDGKAVAVWDEIQRLPPAMLRGDHGSQQKSLAEISVEEWDRAWRVIHAEARKEPPRVLPANWQRHAGPMCFPLCAGVEVSSARPVLRLSFHIPSSWFTSSLVSSLS